MDDPWATWGKPQRMMSMSPPPETLDVADPWGASASAVAAKAQAAVSKLPSDSGGDDSTAAAGPSTASRSTSPSTPSPADALAALRGFGMHHASAAMDTARNVHGQLGAAAASVSEAHGHASAAFDTARTAARGLDGLPPALREQASAAAGGMAMNALQSGALDGVGASMLGAAASGRMDTAGFLHAAAGSGMEIDAARIMGGAAAAAKGFDRSKLAGLPTTLMGSAVEGMSMPSMPSMPAMPSGFGAALGGWDSGWGSSGAGSGEPESSKPVRAPSPVRSPSPELGGDVWGTPEPAPMPDRTTSPTSPASPSSPPRTSTHTPPPRPSISSSSAFSHAFSSSSPRASIDAVVRLAEEEGFGATRASLDAVERVSREFSPRASLDAIERLSAQVSRTASPLAPEVLDVSFDHASPRLPSPDASPRPSFDASGHLDVGAADSSLRRSPSFGSDFGGFAGADDPWGAGGGAAGGSEWKDERFGAAAADDNGWGGPTARAEDSEDDDSEGEGDANDKHRRGSGEDVGAEYESWGGVSRQAPEPTASKQETEWETAQRRIAVQEARAPHGKIAALKRGWDEVAASVITDKLENPTEAEESKAEAGVREMQENVDETLRSLTRPEDTRIPPLHTLTTHQRYTSALSRANPNTSTSFLHAPPSMRARRLEGLTFGPGLDDNWGGRSRLGEPEDASAPRQKQDDDAGSKGWGFWRKSSAPKPLVTSGGGVLEVKTPTASPSTPNETAAAAGVLAATPAVATELASMAPSIASARQSTSRAPSLSLGSRPGTPAAPSPVAPVPASVQEDVGGHDAPSRALGEEQPSGRMGRFFRWGRKAAPVPTDGEAAVDDNMELSADDFAFLAEVVPAAPMEHGTGDLLGGGSSEMNSLERMLNAPKPAPLPAPLAPPPRSGKPVRQSSGSSFVARMAPVAAPRQTAVDLLSGLDFDAPPTMSQSTAASQASPVSSSAWDDFLAPSAPAAPRASSPPVLAPPPSVSAPSHRSSGSFTSSLASPYISSPLAATSTGPHSGAGLTTLQQQQQQQQLPSPRNSSPLATAPPLSMASMLPSPPQPTQRVASPPVMPSMSPMAPSPVQRVASPPVAPSMAPMAPMLPTPRAPAPAQSSFTPMVPTARAASVSPSATGTTGGDVTTSAFDFSAFSATLSPSPTPSMPDLGSGPALYATAPTSLAAGPPPHAPTLAPQMGGAYTPSTAPLTPNGSATPVHPTATANVPPLAPPPIGTRAAPAGGVAPAPPTTAANDDFGDFGDFSAFAAPSAGASTLAPPGGAADSSFDDFGDFGDFSSSSIAPPPVSKSATPSPGPTPPAKTTPPALSSAGYAVPPPPGIGASLAAAAAPAGGRRLTDDMNTVPALPSFSTRKPALTATGSSRRTPSVDHTAALSLVTAANQTSGRRWPAPPSPAPQAIPPPSGFVPPPPGGRKPQVNLLDDFDF